MSRYNPICGQYMSALFVSILSMFSCTNDMEDSRHSNPILFHSNIHNSWTSPDDSGRTGTRSSVSIIQSGRNNLLYLHTIVRILFRNRKGYNEI